MDNVQHIFFDLDHTLWDFEVNSSVALAKLFKEFELHDEGVDFDVFIGIYREINEQYWARYRKNEVQKEELRVGRFLDAFKLVDKVVDYNFADRFAKRYLEISPYQTNLFPNVHEVLSYLKQKYRLHILTNGFEEVQYIKLENSKLKKYFDTVVCSEEVGEKKPHPSVFKFALNKSGGKSENSVMIGDSLQADVQGALDIGMSAVYFNPSKNEVGSEYMQIHDLLDLKKWL